MTVTVLHPADDLFDERPAQALTDDDLGNRLVAYAGQIAALTARFLEFLAEFDKRSAWSGVGILSCAHWLSWRTGMNLRTAQDHVRVCRALTELPKIQEAFEKGELTYSKVRALTRVATPEREPELLSIATSATAEQVERVVRAIRAAGPAPGQRTRPHRLRDRGGALLRHRQPDRRRQRGPSLVRSRPPLPHPPPRQARHATRPLVPPPGHSTAPTAH